MLGDTRIRLLDRLLNCGSDPNRRSTKDFGLADPEGVCERSIWQQWLRAAYVEFEVYEINLQKIKHSARFSSTSEHVKIVISNIAATLLWHGADPTCSVCVSPHHDDGGACYLLSLESVLERFVSSSSTYQLQALRKSYSRRFNRRATRRNHVLRIVRSFLSSGKTAWILASRWSSKATEPFLVNFVWKIGGYSCECSPDCEWNPVLGYAAALCLDCIGGYYLCEWAAHDRYVEVPTHDEAGEHLVHDCLPSDDPHEFISFGKLRFNGGRHQRYGEESISVLENWYARNTNGADFALD